MRRAFIAFGLVVFAVYCWASVVYQNRVAVPGYKLVEVDLLHGKSRAEWDKNQAEQFQGLMALETKNYQLPEDADLGISPEKPLTSGEFAKFIAMAPEGQSVKMTLRDSSAIYGLISRNYLLRDSIPDPQDPDGEPLYVGGHSIDKPMLDNLRARGVPALTVTGHAPPVNFQIGTALMIAVIFFTLVAALKPILWSPFLVMLEKRRRELDIGAEAERQNQAEKSRFEEERRRRQSELGREVQGLRLREQRETTLLTGAILTDARNREKEQKLAGLSGIGQAAEEARREMNAKVPELAQAVADAVTPGKNRGARWDRFVEEE